MTAAGIAALLEPIQERLNAATPGPWKADSYEVIASPYLLIVADVDLHMPDEQGGKNADFIAHAPADTARLLAAVKAVAEMHPREVIAVHEGYGEEAVCPECQLHYPCPTVSAVEVVLRDEA